jgi:YjbE family integral membrane protein
MGLIWTILVGLVVGVVAKLVHPGRDNLGIVMTIILGIAGSLVATLIGQAVGWYQPEQAAGFIGAIIGAVLLLWIGVKLMLPEDEGHADGKAASSHLWGAVRTIVIADAVMSLDNVIAIAAAANGHILLIAIGLIISVPLIIYGSTLVLKVLIRFPILVTLGGGLLGWIAGEISLSDPAIHAWAETLPHWAEKAAAAAGAIFVMALGKILARRMEQKKAMVDLAEERTQ